MSPTVTEFLLARADDERCGLRFENRSWSWREVVRTCAQHASLLRSLRRPGPFHIGVLLGNVPEFTFLLGGTAFSGAVLVGLNPTRRGEALARDVRLTDCQLVVTDTAHAHLLPNTGVPVLLVDSAPWSALLAEHDGAELDPAAADPDDLLVLVFTSGTGGDPKAVRCTHGKIAFPGRMLAERFGLTGEDVIYVAMPLFHSNALMAGWAVGAAAGGTIALRRRFSASGFLPDVRRFGATYANYVGKPLAHVLATPERPDDADNPLRLVYGNEANERDVRRFAERFGCRVVDAFGSTEGGIAIPRSPDTPPGALGRLPDGVAVLDPDTGKPCATARFSPDGQLLNPDEAIGELVNTAGSGWFAGYYNAPAADAERMRDGMYWSGDLAYVDAAGFCRFAGRTADWLRVDGENLATAPIERILLRHPEVREAAVYAVPDPTTGDQVVAALVTTDGFRAETVADFLAAQSDLGPKQWPRYLRLTPDLPRTATHKVLKRHLMTEALDTQDPVYRREGSRYLRELG
ncbi:long-chain-fatty-acid--CoA ligase [Saccharopolyspora sp. NPDC000359]|uniref:long-chain-fatty-acid--CoA ligase n=1 Tax=Saccharopolyspora sp. NPDC000359 TaxID=3154251 RepID=UPI0033191AEB